MAGAMVEGWRLAGLDLSSSVAIRPSGAPVEGLRTVRSLFEAGPAPEIVVLGFKPQMLDEVAPDLRRFVDGAVVVSILAGVELASLKARFPGAKAIVRAMPNLPVAVRRGVVGLVSDGLEQELRDRFGNLFRQLGTAIWSPDEASFGALGSVAGAGPAYVARFIEALAGAGETRGLDPALALTIARETVFGTAWLAAATNDSMDALVARVRSPKGTTEAGLTVLEAELPNLVERTLTAAGQRSRELADAARQIDSPATLH
jgi:pyrroline-5-carboxylate reductase